MSPTLPSLRVLVPGATIPAAKPPPPPCLSPGVTEACAVGTVIMHFRKLGLLLYWLGWAKNWKSERSFCEISEYVHGGKDHSIFHVDKEVIADGLHRLWCCKTSSIIAVLGSDPTHLGSDPTHLCFDPTHLVAFSVLSTLRCSQLFCCICLNII